MNIKKKDLLLVVDMQNVYGKGEPWACRNTEAVCAVIERLLCAGKADEVIFTVFCAPQRPVGTWKAYNDKYDSINADIRLNELMDVFKPYTGGAAGKYPVYSKSAYSSYVVPQVREAVSRAERVAVCGVVAECCILATVESLIDAGAKVIYLRDAITGRTEELEQMTEKIVAGFSDLHTEIMTAEEYLKSI